jgi:hypothetical protein
MSTQRSPTTALQPSLFPPPADICALIPVWRGGSIVAWAAVDMEDYDAVSARRWGLNSNGYPRTSVGGGKTIYLHRFLLGPPPPGLWTDHRNRVRLDNRRRNLRFVTPRESNLNRGRSPAYLALQQELDAMLAEGAGRRPPERA